MSYSVAVGEFEGPLGLLLELVERGRMSVTSITVTDITSSYLATLSQLSDLTPEDLSEFVALGARLIYIKSQALLPKPAAPSEPDELASLVSELEEYRQMKQAAALLGHMPNSTWPRSTVERLDVSELPQPNISLESLSSAFASAMARIEPPIGRGTIKTQLTIHDMANRIKNHLRRGAFKLDELLSDCQDRIEIVTTFLAMLELIRTGMARVTQESSFAPMLVEDATRG